MFEHLVSIEPDGGTHGRWFGADAEEARAWAAEENLKGRGIYFTVNAVTPGTHKKPSKTDICAVRFAHVDIDPTGPDWDKERAYADLMARGAPSVVIDSGNGWQALWALVGSHTHEEVERVNRGLIHAFGADKGTWNVDRLFRFPDSINFPNAKKRAAGRTEALASMRHHSDVRYDLAALTTHFPFNEVAHVGSRSGEIDPLDFEIIDPPRRCSDHTLGLIELPEGHDRSVDVSRVVAAMARDGCTDAEIMGVILNPTLAISAHCLDQKDPERAARRKVWLASEHRLDVDSIFPPIPGLADAPSEPPAKARARKAGFGSRAHSFFMGVTTQYEHFEGCTYISQRDRVLMPDGQDVRQSAFDVLMGGYVFAMDVTNEKSTKSAWEAFLKNNAYVPPTAHNVCFRPELEPFEMVEDGTLRLINIYQPIETPRKKGDPSPLLNHLRKILPDERDRRILLSYMASLVQNPGVKFQWWPVIQGAKGNGKTMLLNLMVHCVGEQYSHLPNVAKMTRNGISFNGWMQGKLFLGLDEVYSAHRRDFLEEFKPYVTNRRLTIEAKGMDEYTGDNRANGMMLTNHEDGVPSDKDERRYAVFFTAQQTAEDCFRDGLTPSYFQKLWAWLDAEGFSIMNDYLREYAPDPEFDPAGMASRAPRTSSTERAIVASRGRAETEILDAVDEGRMGFKGGFVSSRAVSRLLDEKRVNLPRNRYRDVLASIGYVPHPWLIDGKTTGAVMPDGGRTILYVVKGETPPDPDTYPDIQLGAP